MALSFQNIPIKFQGLNRKVDDRQGIAGLLVKCENAWQDKTGKFQKRYGYDKVTLGATERYYNPTGLTALAEWRGSLVGFSGSASNISENNFYVSDSTFLPNRNGIYWPAKLEFYRARGNVGDVLAYCYTESDNYKYLTFKTSIFQHTKEFADLSSYTLTDLLGVTTGWDVSKSFGVSDGLYILASEIGDFDFKLVKLTEVNGILTAGAVVQIDPGAGSLNTWDAVYANENGTEYLYIISSATAAVIKYNIAADTMISASIIVTSGKPVAIDVHSGYVWAASCTTNVISNVLNISDLSTVKSSTLILSTGGAASVGFTTWEWVATTGVVMSDGSVVPSAWATANNGYTRSNSSDAILYTDIQYSQVCSRGFFRGGIGLEQHDDDRYYANGIALCWIRIEPDPNDTTNNVFIAMDAGEGPGSFNAKTYAHCLNGRSISLNDNTVPFSDKFMLPVSELTNSLMAIDEIENLDSNSYEYSRLLMTNVGPNVAFYDGRYFTNAGFAYYPGASFTRYDAVGGLTGTYSYVFVATYYDKQGNVHRSAPSLPIVTTPSSQDVVIDTKAYFGMYVQNSGIIEIYRSDNGAVFRRLEYTGSSQSYSGFQMVDDGSYALGPNLYTTGGILEHIAPPAAKTSWASKDRVWLVSAEDPLQVYYSKRLVPFEGPNFTDAFVLQVEDQGGELFAGASLDDKSVLFKESAIYVVFGDGPDELGQGEYSVQQVSYDTGTINPRSVVETNGGIFFASYKGIYVLTRDLQCQFIGAPVDDFDQSNITQAMVLEDRNQVWFFRASGETLVYDTYHGMWYSNKPQAAVGATIINQVPVWADALGGFFYESQSSFQDGATNYDVVIESNWLQLGGVQGYQRCRLVMLAGVVTGSYDYSLVMSYDLGDATTSETFSATATTENKWEFKPEVQKTEAFKFVWTMSGANRGLDIQNFNLDVGTKGGLSRLPDANRKVGV